MLCMSDLHHEYGYGTERPWNIAGANGFGATIRGSCSAEGDNPAHIYTNPLRNYALRCGANFPGEV